MSAYCGIMASITSGSGPHSFRDRNCERGTTAAKGRIEIKEGVRALRSGGSSKEAAAPGAVTYAAGGAAPAVVTYAAGGAEERDDTT